MTWFDPCQKSTCGAVDEIPVTNKSTVVTNDQPTPCDAYPTAVPLGSITNAFKFPCATEGRGKSNANTIVKQAGRNHPMCLTVVFIVFDPTGFLKPCRHDLSAPSARHICRTASAKRPSPVQGRHIQKMSLLTELDSLIWFLQRFRTYGARPKTMSPRFCGLRRFIQFQRQTVRVGEEGEFLPGQLVHAHGFHGHTLGFQFADAGREVVDGETQMP